MWGIMGALCRADGLKWVKGVKRGQRPHYRLEYPFVTDCPSAALFTEIKG